MTKVVEPGAEEPRHFRAFVIDEESRRVVDQVIADLMIPQASIVRGGVRAAIDQLGTQRSPRYLLVDITDAELPLSSVDELSEVCEPGVIVIALGDRNDVGLFRDLMRHGVSDYLVKPITPQLLHRSLLAALGAAGPARQGDKLGRLVAVTGTRGGVGATMLATGIACTIAQARRRRVALVDLDLQFGSAALALDLEPSHGLREALEHPNRIDSLFVERTMIRHSDTLFVLSSEEPLGEPMQPDPAALETLLKELRNKFHYVVVDLPRHLSPLTQHVLQSATNLVITSDLSLAGMRDALRLNAFVPTINAACHTTLVVNRAGEHRDGEIGRKEFETAVGRPLDFSLPFDGRNVAAAMNGGHPVIMGRSKLGEPIARITDVIAGSSKRSSRPSRFRLWPRRSR